MKTRSSWKITLSVWKALLLREAVSRMFGRRAAVLWLFLEPVAGIAFMMFVFTVLRSKHVGGMHTAIWLSAGILGFYMFRRTAGQGTASIGANLALFTYRQVKPVDTIITRCVLEGFILLLISSVIFGVLALLGVSLWVDDLLEVLLALGGLWLLALGWSMCTSVASELLPELGNTLNLLLVPLMLISGVIFPLSAIPYPWLDWLMFNPVAHGVEGVRAGISPYYHHVQGLSLVYLYAWVLVMVFLGLALQVRYRERLVAL